MPDSAESMRQLLLALDPIITMREESDGDKFPYRLSYFVERWGWEEALKQVEIKRLVERASAHIDGCSACDESHACDEHGALVRRFDPRLPIEQFDGEK